MALVNQKGGFHTTLRVTQNTSADAICMLRKPFLKKSGNWTLQVTDFFINKTPPLNQTMDEQLRFVPLVSSFHAGWRPEDYIFTPQNCFTVCEYVVQLQEFFRKFSFLFWRYGIGSDINYDIQGVGQQAFITTDFHQHPFNYVQRNNVLEDGELFDEGYLHSEEQFDPLCSCFLGADLKIYIHLHPVFLGNFFIHCSDDFVTKMGFSQYIFAYSAGGVVYKSPGDYLFQEGPALAGGYPPVVHAHTIPENDYTWSSDATIRALDERVSLDVVCTFPTSRKISVLDGIEQHEFLLARFDLGNYKQFRSVTSQSSDQMLGTVQIEETFMAGIENLTRGNSNFESNLLLPGSIHQVHLMLYTRFRENGIIKRVKTEMEDAFWHIRMLFSKKM